MSNHRYVTLGHRPASTASQPRPQGGYYDYSIGDNVLMPDSCTVVEMDKSPLETGLLNADGQPLYRVIETVRIGFHNR